MPDTLDAAHKVIVLAFDLLDGEIDRLPGQLKKTLESAPVQKTIQKSLLDFAKSKSGPSVNTVVTSEEAQKLLKSLTGGIQKVAPGEFQKQVEKTPEYHKLKRAAQEFQKAAKTSPLGVWVDKNKGVLYIVGAALVVGSASVLYVTRTGGKGFNMAMNPLEGKDFEIVQIGSIKINGSVLDFQPDARIVGAQLSGNKKWEQVQIELKIGAIATDGQIDKVQGSAVMKSKAINLNISGSTQPQKNKVDLALKLTYEGHLDAGKFNIGVGAKYADEALSATVNAALKTKNVTYGVTGSAGPHDSGGNEFRGMFTLDIPL